jgi:SHS family lactate transporter-like MFS transporter
MGGEWGVGAALVFETLPTEGRGAFSGILQQGYAAGSILAAGLYALFFHGFAWGWLACPAIGWRGLFILGAMPALLVLYVRMQVEESPVWLEGKKKRLARSARPSGRPTPSTGSGQALAASLSLRLGWDASTPANLLAFLPTFLFLVLLMTAFMSFSHGTQDVYPTFLATQARLSPETVGLIGVLYGFGSIAGGFVFGALSEKWGRKRAIVAAALLAIPVIPLYAYGHSAVTLGIGAVLMQFMVQGAWGVVPAYLTSCRRLRYAPRLRGWPTSWAAC